MSQSMFRPGERVRHAERPEWGAGVVETAVTLDHEGQPAQRLTITFDHKGRTTVHTGYARVVPASQGVGRSETAAAPAAPAAPHAGSNGASSVPAPAPAPAAAPAAAPTLQTLMGLPEVCTDPLSGLSRRLRHTLMLYRFTAEPRSLMDWAVAQTGLYDPLSEFSRHDLESAFKYFQHNRESHLRELVRAIRKAGQTDVFRQLDPQTPQAARQALAKAIAA